MEKTEASAAAKPFAPSFLHGTKAGLQTGDFIRPAFPSNFSLRKGRYVYFSATLDAAIWGAELARGTGSGRIYLVETTGDYEDDPHLSNQKFQGNPSLSYRSAFPLKIIGEVRNWQGHSAAQIHHMKQHIEELAVQGIEAKDE